MPLSVTQDSSCSVKVVMSSESALPIARRVRARVGLRVRGRVRVRVRVWVWVWVRVRVRVRVRTPLAACPRPHPSCCRGAATDTAQTAQGPRHDHQEWWPRQE